MFDERVLRRFAMAGIDPSGVLDGFTRRCMCVRRVSFGVGCSVHDLKNILATHRLLQFQNSLQPRLRERAGKVESRALNT